MCSVADECYLLGLRTVRLQSIVLCLYLHVPQFACSVLLSRLTAGTITYKCRVGVNWLEVRCCDDEGGWSVYCRALNYTGEDVRHLRNASIELAELL